MPSQPCQRLTETHSTDPIQGSHPLASIFLDPATDSRGSGCGSPTLLTEVGGPVCNESVPITPKGVNAVEKRRPGKRKPTVCE